MAPWDEKTRVTTGTVSLQIPAVLVQRQEAPIDSAASVFEGSGVTVVVDQGPFANRLDAHVGRPDYEQKTMDVGGITGHTVFYRNPEGQSYTRGIHVPAVTPVTVVVHAEESVPEQVPTEIIESIRLLD